MLAIVVALLAQVSTPLGAKSSGNLGQDLYYGGSLASGSKLCDRNQAARYAANEHIHADIGLRSGLNGPFVSR